MTSSFEFSIIPGPKKTLGSHLYIRFRSPDNKLIKLSTRTSDEKTAAAIAPTLIRQWLERKACLSETTQMTDFSNFGTYRAHLAGEAFFNAISEFIAKTLSMDVVFVGEYKPDSDSVAVLGGYSNGEVLSGFSYDLAGTPCENVVRESLCVYPSAVQELFPADEQLVEMGIESYIGSPIQDAQGNPLGIMVALHSGVLIDPTSTATQFNSYFDRVRAELLRKQAQDSLEKSEERYRLLFQNASIGIGYYETDGRIISFNSVALQSIGMAAEDVEGKCFEDLFPAEYAAIYKQRFADLLRLQETLEFEDEVALPSGNLWFLSAYSCVYRPDGTISGVQIIAIDITDRKSSEKKLLESEARFRTYFEQNPSATFLWKVDGNCISLSNVNLVAEELSPGTARTLIGKTIEQLYADRPDLIERFNICQEKKQTLVYETEYIDRGTGPKRDIVFTFTYISPSMIMLHTEDITQRKKSELALQESHELLSHFMLHSPIYAYIKSVTTTESRVLYASENYKDMIGISGRDMVGKNMFELFPDEFAQKITADDWAVVARGVVLKLDEELNGRTYTTIKFPIILKDRNILAGYTIDETERRAAEAALRENEQMFREAQEVAQLGSYAWDIVGGKWKSSHIMDEIFGIDEAYDRTLDGWLALVHPDWREIMSAYMRHDVLEQRKPFDKEYKIIHQSSGNERWLHGKGDLALDADNRPVKLFGTNTDITFRKAADEQIRVLSKGVEQSPAAIVITDPNGNIEFVNTKFTEVTGYHSDEAVGCNSRILKSGEKTSEEYRDLWETITAGNEWNGEFHNKKKTGELYWENASISPIYDEKGRIAHFIAVKEDITQRKAEEHELILAKERAERMDKLKDAFIANISHEIRTPLNAIAGFSTLIQEASTIYLNETQQGYFEHIQFGVDRLMRTVDLILILSRIQSGDIQLNPRIIDIPLQLDFIKESLGFQAKQKGISLSVINDVGPLEVLTDEYCLTEAVSNLVNNAIKFTNEGAVTLHLSEGSEAQVYLDVIDTGIGISEDYKPYLFEPYSQEEIGYSRRYEGIGLGMTLVKKYLDLLEIPITFFSKKHLGTTFRIELTSSLPEPRVVSSSNNPSRTKNKLHNPGATMQEPSPANILLVEDDPASIRLIQEIVPSEYTLYFADDADGVHTQIQINHIDLILMDVSLKGEKDGLQITRGLRKMADYESVPIIAVTAHAFPEDGINCINAGCSEYFAKPVVKQHLLQTISRLLAEARAS